MPHEMDVKYNVFMLTLHVFLALVSLVSLASAGCYFYAFRRGSFNYLNKSNSDLSELSLRSANNRSVEQATGTCQSYFEAYSPAVKVELEAQNRHALGNVLREHHQAWNSDMSNISTTVSSTNSRRPCISKAKGAEDEVDAEDLDGIGLDTILPVLMVCYLFNHVPTIVSTVFSFVAGGIHEHTVPSLEKGDCCVLRPASAWKLPVRSLDHRNVSNQNNYFVDKLLI